MEYLKEPSEVPFITGISLIEIVFRFCILMEILMNLIPGHFRRFSSSSLKILILWEVFRHVWKFYLDDLIAIFVKRGKEVLYETELF